MKTNNNNNKNKKTKNTLAGLVRNQTHQYFMLGNWVNELCVFTEDLVVLLLFYQHLHVINTFVLF